MIGQSNAAAFTDAQQYFDGAWSNLNGRQMSVGYEQDKDESNRNMGYTALWSGSGYRRFNFATPLFFAVHLKRHPPSCKMKSPSF